MVSREQADHVRVRRGLCTRPSVLAALIVAAAVDLPSVVAARDPDANCDRACLAGVMSQYLVQVVGHSPRRVSVASDSRIRENTSSIGFGGGVWKHAKKLLRRQDFIDTTSGNVYAAIELQLDDGRVLHLSERLTVRDRAIWQIETVVGDSADAQSILREVITPEHRSTREQLLGIANGYFEALGMRDLHAARLAQDCTEYVGGRSIPCLDGLDRRTGQQAIERRFPLAIPELGVVIGYAFLMHHERTPPQDDFINIRLQVIDGRIVAVESIGATVTAPGRSGFEADFPAPQILRAAPATAAAVATASEPAATHFPGYWRLHALRDRLFPGPPQAQLPSPPYPGIEDTRDIAYGADPRQRLDILAPTPTSQPRTVLVFVHGGAWAGGDKHFPNDILYENIVFWAARQGMVAVNLDYRLADYGAGRNLYPTQEQDVAAAMDWIGVNIAHYGGDPRRIFMWGHSAGGSTIASYASDPKIYGATPGVKGIFLLSSPLDPAAEEQSGHPIPYFGVTHTQYVQNAPLRTLVSSDVPVLIGYSPQETDMAPELRQAIRTLCEHGHCPMTVATHGTHDGEVRAVGSEDHTATDALLAFMAKIP
jgi:acetyl esterase/lipase